MKKTLLAAVAASGLFVSGASAATLNGEFWDAAPGTVANVTQGIAIANSRVADALFTSTAINYGDPDGPAFAWDIDDLNGFLDADNTSTGLGLDASSIVAGAASGTTDFQESILRISGNISVNTGDVITVTSDDGFRLIVNGIQLNPGVDNAGVNCNSDEGIRPPNCTNNMAWTGASGTYFATLWYIEGNESQAQLVSNLVDFATPVPVPAGLLLMITAVGGLGAMRGRRKA